MPITQPAVRPLLFSTKCAWHMARHPNRRRRPRALPGREQLSRSDVTNDDVINGWAMWRFCQCSFVFLPHFCWLAVNEGVWAGGEVAGQTRPFRVEAARQKTERTTTTQRNDGRRDEAAGDVARTTSEHATTQEWARVACVCDPED